MNRQLQIVGIAIATCGLAWAGFGATAVVADAPGEDETAYTKTITERADKIVAPLGIEDDAKTIRARDLVANQYRDLRDIHAARDETIKALKQKGGEDATVTAAGVKAAQDEASLKMNTLHRKFVARLSAELTPQQVDQIKDGMTYGVVQVTYRHYLELLPDLTTEQKSEILANLLEAREYAMDGGSSKEKHEWFGKYKGRINNYLSAAGYSMKQAEADWAAKTKASPQSK